MSEDWIDIGHGHKIRYTGWWPDREINPQYKDMPDIDKIGIIVDTGNGCKSMALFDLPGVAELMPGRPVWQVQSWEPLTLSPSLLCQLCGDHGFIQNGRWVPA